MNKMLKFPKPDECPDTLEGLVRKTHELAKRSENIYFDHPHAKERMAERNI